MIVGYALNGNDEEALKMRWKALMMGMTSNVVKFTVTFGSFNAHQFGISFTV